MNQKFEFINFLSSLGLEPKGDLVFGRIARANVINDPRGKDDGSYCYHGEYGWAENHKLTTGVVNWKFKQETRMVSHQPIQSMSLMDDVAKYARAQLRAQKIYDEAYAMEELHTYLVKKGFTKDEARVKEMLANCRVGSWTKSGKKVKNCLIVPIVDSFNKLWSVQSIDPDGNKDLLWGGRKTNNFFVIHPINKNTTKVFVAEGLATALSVSLMYNGAPVLVAIDAGNLPRVALQAKLLYPNHQLLVAGDNDSAGREACRLAQLATNCQIILPNTEGEDFNDDYIK